MDCERRFQKFLNLSCIEILKPVMVIEKFEYKSEKILEDILKRERNIVDLIAEMKNLVSIAIETGFSAMITQDRKLVERTREMEEEIDIRQYEIETECMLATKDPEEALELTSVIKLSSVLEEISNAIGDLLASLSRGIPVHPKILDGLKNSMGIVNYIEVGKRSKCIGKSIAELSDGVDVIGLKRDSIWTHLPKKTEAIMAGDMVVVSGKADAVAAVCRSMK